MCGGYYRPLDRKWLSTDIHPPTLPSHDARSPAPAHLFLRDYFEWYGIVLFSIGWLAGRSDEAHTAASKQPMKTIAATDSQPSDGKRCGRQTSRAAAPYFDVQPLRG